MSQLPEYFFVGDEGHLYDTRDPEWHKKPPLRYGYNRPYSQITSLAEVKAALRYGPYCFPGGYEMHFISKDGHCYSFQTVRDNFREVVEAFMDDNRWMNEWLLIATDVNWEDPWLTDDHTGEQLRPAYMSEEETAHEDD